MKINKEKFLALSLSMNMAFGKAEAAEPEFTSVDFSCPRVLPDGNKCPKGYKLGRKDFQKKCVINGKHTNFDQDVNSKGKITKIKRSEGTCKNSTPDGPAKSWHVDKNGNSVTVSGTYDMGMLKGTVKVETAGVVTMVACNAVMKDYYGSERSKAKWGFYQEEAPGIPEKPNSKNLSKEEFKKAMEVYKKELSANKSAMAQMKIVSKKLASLQSFCPQANDQFCQTWMEDDSPISEIPVVVNPKLKDDDIQKYRDIKSISKTNHTGVCKNNLAMIYETVDVKPNDLFLEIEKTSMGIASLKCVDRGSGSTKWFVGRNVPTEKTKEYLQNSDRMKKMVKSCEQPSDALCAFFKNVDGAPFSDFQPPSEDTCMEGFLVSRGGQTLKNDWGEKLRNGFNWEKIGPGYTMGACGDIQVPDSCSSMDCSAESSCCDYELHWNIENPYPGESLAIFKKNSAIIEALGKTCPTMGNSYCITIGECSEKGNCEWDKKKGECKPANKDHCTQSKACKDNGLCDFFADECVENHWKEKLKN